MNLTLAYGTKKAVIRIYHTQEDYFAGEGENLLVTPDELDALLDEDMVYFCDECKTFHVKDNWEYEIDKELEAIERWLKERG
jgi:hypothetical protein